MRENRTCSLCGGRWPARKRATSDPTPAKCPNKGEQAPAEGMEGRRPTKENIGQATPPRTQSRTSELSDLHGVREVARRVNLIPTCASTPGIRGRSRMQQFCTYGSVRGAPGNRRPYRDKTPKNGRLLSSNNLIMHNMARNCSVSAGSKSPFSATC